MEQEKKFSLKNLSLKDLFNNKDVLFEKSKNVVSAYSDFVEQAKSNKMFQKILENSLKEMEEMKDDYENGRLRITFNVHGSKLERFGGKVNREDIYVIDNKDELKQNLEQYFFKDAPLVAKKNRIDELLIEFGIKEECQKHKVKALFDKIIEDNVKELNDNNKVEIIIGTARVEITIEPVGHIYEIKGSKGSKIDLTK